MPSINRGKIWSTLWTMPFRFLNVNLATKWIVKQGLGYKKQTMWHDVRAAFDEVYKKPFQEEYGLDDYLPQNLFVEKDWRRPQSYYYYGNIYKKDIDTGEIYRSSYSFYEDSSLTDRELTEIAYHIEEQKTEGTPPYGEVIAFESLVRYHKWGAPRSEGYRISEI